MGLNGRRHCSVSCPPTKTKEPSQKQKNADPDHGAQNRGKSTQNEGKELLSPDSREVDRSMISPSISPAAHQDDVERKKQKHPLRLQQAQAQTLKLDEVRQYVILLNELLSKAYSRHANCTPVLPPLAIPFSETPPTTAKSEAHGEHHALPEIQENAKTLERREEETASHRTPITPLSINAFQIPSAVSFSPARLSSPRYSLLSPTRVSRIHDDDITRKSDLRLYLTSSTHQVYIDEHHRYNDLKDAGQILLGKLAEQEGTTVKDLNLRYDPSIEDRLFTRLYRSICSIFTETELHLYLNLSSLSTLGTSLEWRGRFVFGAGQTTTSSVVVKTTESESSEIVVDWKGSDSREERRTDITPCRTIAAGWEGGVMKREDVLTEIGLTVTTQASFGGILWVGNGAMKQTSKTDRTGRIVVEGTLRREDGRAGNGVVNVDSGRVTFASLTLSMPSSSDVDEVGRMSVVWGRGEIVVESVQLEDKTGTIWMGLICLVEG
ncbi:hypothetical protein BLNAU_1106 [Blattamonas nauphoetae]|uniref:Uncharacterized protein n=1 Tax=Blattamonas nauphoetae TaxID=2049346 RepID=A0ABQ9YK46_9EUKA|nr:hypothetical protein BLNAU_1106 [Blattamonas nauphoetae]